MTLHQQACGAAAQCHSGRVIQRPPGDDVFGLSHVRNDLFRRLPRAAGHTREGERGAHQFEERPPLDGIEGTWQPRRELVADELVEVGALFFLERPPELLRTGWPEGPALIGVEGLHR